METMALIVSFVREPNIIQSIFALNRIQLPYVYILLLVHDMNKLWRMDAYLLV